MFDNLVLLHTPHILSLPARYIISLHRLREFDEIRTYHNLDLQQSPQMISQNARTICMFVRMDPFKHSAIAVLELALLLRM